MAGAEALIVLSLLGCNDNATQCDFLRAEEQRFETIEACRAASGPLLVAAEEADYPAVVAVCSPEVAPGTAVAEAASTQEPQIEPPTEGAATAETETAEPVVPLDVAEPGLLARIGRAIESITPDRKTLMKPVDMATEGANAVGGAVIVGVKRVADAVNPF